jgi:tetratricopeptide (TPR) repeat protein
MNKTIFRIIFCLAFVLNVIAQESESQKLTKNSLELYQQGKIVEAIELAEKAVSIDMTLPNKNWDDLASSVFNLALLQKEHYWFLAKDSNRQDITKEQVGKNTGKQTKYFLSIPKNLRQVIDIYENKLKVQSLNLATAKIELGLFENKNTDTPMFPLEKETESLFDSGLQIREKLLGLSDDITISTFFAVADMYEKKGFFEKAIINYEKYIIAIEKKYGTTSQYLLPALRSLAFISFSTENQKESEGIVSRIESITRKKETRLTYYLDLTLRNTRDEFNKLMIDPNTITTYLKKQKWLLVHVLLDEKGNVIDLNAENPLEKDMFGKDVKEKAEKEVRRWKFKPFVYQDIKRKVKGVVWFPYFVKA